MNTITINIDTPVATTPNFERFDIRHRDELDEAIELYTVKAATARCKKYTIIPAGSTLLISFLVLTIYFGVREQNSGLLASGIIIPALALLPFIYYAHRLHINDKRMRNIVLGLTALKSNQFFIDYFRKDREGNLHSAYTIGEAWSKYTFAQK